MPSSRSFMRTPPGRGPPTASPSRSTPGRNRSTCIGPTRAKASPGAASSTPHCPPGSPSPADPSADDTTPVAARSVVVLAEEPDHAPRRRSTGVEAETLDRLADRRRHRRRMVGRVRRAPHRRRRHEARSARGDGIAGGIDRRSAHCASPQSPMRANVACCRRWSSRARDRPRRSPSRCRAKAGIVACELRLQQEDGTEHALPFAYDDLPANVDDCRRRTHGRAGGCFRCRRCRLATTRCAGTTIPAIPAAWSSLRARCFVPSEIRGGGRRFGLAAHLYALHRRGDQGIGDFTTLSALAEVTARAGGSIVGINPLHMLFADDRERASPYHPSDRRFLDPRLHRPRSRARPRRIGGCPRAARAKRPALRGAFGADQRRLHRGRAPETGGAAGMLRALRATRGR